MTSSGRQRQLQHQHRTSKVFVHIVIRDEWRIVRSQNSSRKDTPVLAQSVCYKPTQRLQVSASSPSKLRTYQENVKRLFVCQEAAHTEDASQEHLGQFTDVTFHRLSV